MDKADVVVAEGKDIAGEVAVDLLGAGVILKILVVSEDINTKFGSQQKVTPMFKCANNGEEFTIPDWVVAFCFSEGGGVITHRVL